MVEVLRVISLSPGSWLSSLGNNALSGARGGPLMPAEWALNNGHSQTGLGEWKSMVLRPCITFTPDIGNG